MVIWYEIFVNDSYFCQPSVSHSLSMLIHHLNGPTSHRQIWPGQTLRAETYLQPSVEDNSLLFNVSVQWCLSITRCTLINETLWCLSMFLSVLNKSLYFIVLYCKHSVKRTATVFNENASALQCTVALILYDHLFLCFCFVKPKTWQHPSIMLFVTVTLPDPVSTNF